MPHEQLLAAIEDEARAALIGAIQVDGLVPAQHQLAGGLARARAAGIRATRIG